MNVPAWQGNWEKRIYERVFARDFPSLTAFAESQPTATLSQLARELGPESDVAPIQVERLLRQEAHESGDLHRFARAALVREIQRFFPLGWMRGEGVDFGRGRVYGSWRSRVGEEFDAPTERVFDSLETAAPVGWLPTGPDDPIILQAFRDGQFPEDRKSGKKADAEDHD